MSHWRESERACCCVSEPVVSGSLKPGAASGHLARQNTSHAAPMFSRSFKAEKLCNASVRVLKYFSLINLARLWGTSNYKQRVKNIFSPIFPAGCCLLIIATRRRPAKGLGFVMVSNRHGPWVSKAPWLRVQGRAARSQASHSSSFGSHEELCVESWPRLLWLQASMEAPLSSELYNTSLMTIIIIINKITGDLRLCVCTNCRYVGGN